MLCGRLKWIRAVHQFSEPSFSIVGYHSYPSLSLSPSLSLYISFGKKISKYIFIYLYANSGRRRFRFLDRSDPVKEREAIIHCCCCFSPFYLCLWMLDGGFVLGEARVRWGGAGSTWSAGQRRDASSSPSHPPDPWRSSSFSSAA